MTKIRKVKRRKRFRTNVNRKRLRNKLTKLPNIECEEIKEAWEKKRSTVKNLINMGLAYDPNQVIKIPNMKKEMIKFMSKNGEIDESNDEENEECIPKKLHVAQNLEADARHPRAKLFRLPNNEVHFVTSMMDKYGDDYKAMERDRKNYNQLTVCQIKRKIERFKSIPEQYAEYLVKKGEIILDDPAPLKKIKPQILHELPKKKVNAKPSRRKRKKTSLIDSIWQEESLVEDESSTNKIHASNIDDNSLSDKINDEPKLQLFSEDESDDDQLSEQKNMLNKNKKLLKLDNSKNQKIFKVK